MDTILNRIPGHFKTIPVFIKINVLKKTKAFLSQMTQIFTDTQLYFYPGIQKLKEKCRV